MSKKIKTVRLDDETLERITRIAAEHDRTVSEIIRLAIKKFLEKHK
jgi:predicted transcriptional regulator